MKKTIAILAISFVITFFAVILPKINQVPSVIISPDASGDFDEIYNYVFIDKTDMRQYFGGCYYNDESQLVSLFTHDFKELSDEIEYVSTIANRIEFVEFSNDEIWEMYDYIHAKNWEEQGRGADYLEESAIQYFGGCLVSEEKNRVYIYIDEINEDKIAGFKEIFGDNPIFEFDDSDNYMIF